MRNIVDLTKTLAWSLFGCIALFGVWLVAVIQAIPVISATGSVSEGFSFRLISSAVIMTFPAWASAIIAIVDYLLGSSASKQDGSVSKQDDGGDHVDVDLDFALTGVEAKCEGTPVIIPGVNALWEVED